MKTDKKILLCCFGLSFHFAAYNPVFAKTPEYPGYVAGEMYTAGEIVRNRGGLYQCKKWPYSGWCRQAAYAPGVSIYWSNAWNRVADVNAGKDGSAAAGTTNAGTISTGKNSDIGADKAAGKYQEYVPGGNWSLSKCKS